MEAEKGLPEALSEKDRQEWRDWQELEIDVGTVEVSLAATGISVLMVNAEVHLALRIVGAIAFVLSTFAAYLIGWLYVFRKIPLTRKLTRDFPVKHAGISGIWMLYGWPVRLVTLVLQGFSSDEGWLSRMTLYLEHAYLALWSALTVIWVAGFVYVIASFL